MCKLGKSLRVVFRGVKVWVLHGLTKADDGFNVNFY